MPRVLIVPVIFQLTSVFKIVDPLHG